MDTPFLLIVSYRDKFPAALLEAAKALSTTPTPPGMAAPGLVIVGVTWNGTAHDFLREVLSAGSVGIVQAMVIRPGSDWSTTDRAAISGWLTRAVGAPKPQF